MSIPLVELAFQIFILNIVDHEAFPIESTGARFLSKTGRVRLISNN